MVNLPLPKHKQTSSAPSSTSRQALLRQPAQPAEDKWYAGDTPSSSEVLARIYTIGKQDSQKGQQLWDAYGAQLADPTSPFYSPYLQPTNPAFNELANLGVDMSGGINDSWLEQNSWMKNYYRMGASGSPLAPSSESTAENNAAYWYYKVLGAEENTQKAENEWAALQEEVSYWAWRPDRNYSDEKVLAKIDWRKYPTLKKMDEGLASGVPLSLNRRIDYSQDALRGVIWAARNDGGTGSLMLDGVSAVLGRGNAWSKNDYISSRLDPSSESYNPYVVGSTMDEAGLYFGTSGFNVDWLEENKGLRDSMDLTAKNLYEQVYSAEQTTQKAEAELAQLEQDINDYLSVTSDPDRIIGYLDMSDYPTLQKMDKSLKSGDLLALNRAVGYDWKDIEAQIRKACVPALPLPQRGASAIATALGVEDNPTEAYIAIRDAKNANLNRAGLDVFQAGTEAEKIVFKTARDSDFADSANTVYEAILNGSTTADAAYQDGLALADEFAGSNYVKALEGIRPYERAVADRAEATKELEAMLLEKPWMALYAQSPAKPNGTTAADIVSAYASQYDSRTASNAMYDIWRKVDSLVNGTPFAEGYVGYPDLGESEWERMEAQFNGIDWSEGLKAYEMQQRLAELDASIEELRPAYDEGIAMAEDVHRRYANADRVAETFGGTRRGGYATTALLDYAYEYGEEYVPTKWSAYTLYDAALAGGYAPEMVAQAAERSIADYEAHLADVETVLSELEARGAMPAGDYRKNLERERNLMQRSIADAKYYLIRENEDFEKVVEETRAKVSEAWGWNTMLPTIPRDGFSYDSYLMVEPYAPTSEPGATPWQQLMTGEEHNTYLYILGTDGENAAAAYYRHLRDDSYGVLHTRYSQQMSEAAQTMAEGGWFGDTLATAVTVLMSPSRIAGSMYTALAGLTGAEINPNNEAFGANIFIDETRSAIKQDIIDNFGEGTPAAFFANLGYDGITAFGDSTANAVSFGKAGAVMMGLSAAGETARDVKLRGGDDTQALLMAGAAAAAETISEALTIDNMRTLFRKPPKEFKTFLGKLLTNAGEEGLGEAVSEVATGLADREIMDELSNFNASVQAYLEDGLSQEEAERRAILDALSNILYSGIVGVASSVGTTSASAGAGMAINRTAKPPVGQQGVALTDTQTSSETTNAAEEAPATEETPAGKQLPALPKDYTRIGTAANAVEALSTASRMVEEGTAAEPARTSAIAAALALADPNGVGPSVTAAAEMGSHRYGGKPFARALTDVITEATAAGLPVQNVLEAVSVASLVEGEARVAMDAIVNDYPDAGKLSALIAGAAEDMKTRAAEAQAAVADSTVANRVKDLIADGGLSGLQSYDAAVSQAQENLDNARDNLQQAQTQLETTGKNLRLVSEQYLNDPGNASMRGAVQQATKDVESANIVRQQMEQSVAKYEVQLQEAQDTRDSVLDTTLTQLREQARADVDQMQEAARQQQEQAAADAENQRLLDNVTAVETEAFMAENGYEGASDEQRQLINSAVAGTRQPADVSKAGFEFASALSRRFGIKVAFGDGQGAFDAAYDSDRDTILLDRNATQGQAIYTFAAHELTHRAETSGYYKELASTLLQMRYGDDIAARQADLNAIRAQYAGVYKDDADFESELVSMAAQEILGNEESMNRLVAEKPSLARRIWQTIKDFIGKLRGVNDPAVDSLRNLEKLMEKALDQVTKKAIRDFGPDGIKYALRTKEPPKNVVYAYKAFYARDGKLYPPMVSNITNDSDKQKVSKATSGTMKSLPTPVGVWLDADIGGILVDDNGKPVRTSETGRLRVKNDKGGGKDSSLAFRPGWHLGEWPDAKQFNKGPLTEYTTQEGEVKRRRMLMPDDIVFAKCEVSADEDYQLDAISYGVSDKGTFNRSQAGLPYVPEDGYYKYRTNPDPTTAPWLIAGSIRVTEILDDDDCARICAQFGVTPDKRVSGKKINLGDFGLKRGPVEATTEGMERFLENDANRANKKLLEESLTDPDYADAYVAREINFADPNIVKEFQMNGQDADAYQQTYVEKGLVKDRHGLKYSLRANPATDAAQQYSYEHLTSQPDMTIAQMPDPKTFTTISESGKWQTDKARAREEGLGSVREKNSIASTAYLLFVDNAYTSIPLQVNKESLNHGMIGSRDRQQRNAAAASIVGDLATNAIPVNELIPKQPDKQPWVKREYLYVALAQDETSYYPVAMVVQSTDEDLGQITHIEALEGIDKRFIYSIDAVARTKKGTGSDGLATSQRDSTSTDSTISIADLLTLVKDDFADGFSADVLAHLGLQRPEGHFSKGVKYAKSDVTLPSIQGGLEAQVRAWRNPPEAQQGRQPDRAERQFASQTAQHSQAMPPELRQELLQNDEQHYYDTDTNRAQLDRAWERYQQDGFEASRDRILQAEHLTTNDIAMANLLMALAFRSGDVNSAMELAHRYNVEGTAQGQALQARQLFSRMTPTGARAWIAGRAEADLAEHMRTHQRQRRRIDEAARQVAEDIQDMQSGDQLSRLNAAREFTVDESNNHWGIPINEQQQALIDQYRLNNVRRPGVFYNRATTKQRMLEAILATPNPLELTGNGLNLIQRLEYLRAGEAVITNADLNYIGMHLSAFAASDVDTQGGREGDLHLSRAYEAYGNITPATGREKARTWRYTSMLLSVPSAMRNVIGNALQGTVNATSHGIAVELDRIASQVTGERTMAHLSAADRVAGWEAFVTETQNTFRDFFTDKSITRHGEDRYNLDQRGRVFQNQPMEAMRLVEGYLMSVGDRNFWRRAYVNSIAEQQRVAAANGVELDYEEAAVRATHESNYATFNEDNAVRDAFGVLKRVPVLGDVLDFIMPFTGVPTNIVSRMWQYSPMGLATSVIRHGWRGVTRQDFNQLDFVNSMSRGLTGTALFAAGMALASVGFLKLGTGEEEDKKVYGVEAAQGKQYAPYIQVGDEYISLSAFAPAVSPLVAGAAAFDIFQEDEDHFQALFNAGTAMLDQIFDASYMSNLKDIFGGYGSIAENTANVVMSSAISQNIPSVVSQLALALDPYVRDTKDKNALIQTLNAGLIQKIPGLREMLPEKVDVAGRSVISKEGLRNFFDPLTTTNAIDDPALDELMRLHEELGTSDFLPSDALSGTKTALTGVAAEVAGEDKEAYRKRYGELWRLGGSTYDKDGNRVTLTGVTDLMQTSAYQKMSNAEKAEAIKGIVQAAKEGAVYEMGEKLGHTPKASSSSSSGYAKQAVRAMPEQFARSKSPWIQQLAQWYEQTGDGAFIPKGIGRSFSRDTVQYNLTDVEYKELWGRYEAELDVRLAKIDWTASAEEVAQAVSKAYTNAADSAKNKYVKNHK